MRLLVASLIVATAMAGGVRAERPTDPVAKDAWVQLPKDGETSAKLFATFENPGTYDAYLEAVSSDVSASVEWHDAAKNDVLVKDLLVIGYDKVVLDANGSYLKLVGLRRPLHAGDAVNVVLKTDSLVEIQLTATVR